jgi:hypothetical protein
VITCTGIKKDRDEEEINESTCELFVVAARLLPTLK